MVARNPRWMDEPRNSKERREYEENLAGNGSGKNERLLQGIDLCRKLFLPPSARSLPIIRAKRVRTRRGNTVLL